MRIARYIAVSGIFFGTFMLLWQSGASGRMSGLKAYSAQGRDTTAEGVKYPIPADGSTQSPLYLNDPENISETVEYDPETGEYTHRSKVGRFDYQRPYSMNLQEYSDYELDRSVRRYWRQKSMSEQSDRQQGFVPSFNINSEAFDKIFGSNTINIDPQGSAELIFGYTRNKIDNPTISEKLRKTGSFNFDEKIQMNVNGTIGEKMSLGISYNTEATFDFENKTKLEYKGDEDEIIQKIEAGNVTLPLTGSLITGSQSLFGIKTELKFGKLTVTSVLSHQKGESQTINVEGGAQISPFEVSAGDYDANRHFFLAHYFEENYDKAMQNPQYINSSIEITDVEVWVTNKRNDLNGARDIAAFVDLGENKAENLFDEGHAATTGMNYPDNDANGLYNYISGTDTSLLLSEVLNRVSGYSAGTEYVTLEYARKLDERDYDLNRQLGYVSLNTSLNTDEVLAVAFEYTVAGQMGKVYRVGMLTKDGLNPPNALVVKLLKGTSLTPKLPNWELMMKNVYSLNAYQVDRQDFRLDILYQDDKKGSALPYIGSTDTSKIGPNDLLLSVLNLDNLNTQLDNYPDGIFDFIEGITIFPATGKIIFPMTKPFDSDRLRLHLARKMGVDTSDTRVKKFTYPELYTLTKTAALQVAEKNKYLLAGEYKAAGGGDIQLNAMNIPQGSVKVTAGGMQLQENIDYSVDYTLGRVKIINQGLLSSGTPIKVSLENQSLFNFQTKSLYGAHLDYKFSDNFNVGGTILHLKERPLTQKVNIGDEPISNTIWGLNTSYTTESYFLTRMVDKLPLLETKEPSKIRIDAEFAQLIPGSPKAIGKQGISYIDDFEASEISIDLKQYSAWRLSSTPTGNRFPEGGLHNQLDYNFNRAKLSWYFTDQLFTRDGSYTPDYMKDNPDFQGSHYVREILEEEIFKNVDRGSGIPPYITTLNLGFYPSERGPYNFARELEADGRLTNPESRWGGIMRSLVTNDFETSNIEFIEFWLMDPYAEDTIPGEVITRTATDPAVYFNLGDISEDILRDGRKAFEQGLPIPSDETVKLDTTVWGVVSKNPALVHAFDATSAENRVAQDKGLDGLNDEEEALYFADYVDYLNSLAATEGSLIGEYLEDPAGDNFHYYRGGDYDAAQLSVPDRYKLFNGMEGNSPNNTDGSTFVGSNLPDEEDVNLDNTMNNYENFYEYKISMRKEDFRVGSNYIVNEVEGFSSEVRRGVTLPVKWYQFRIPLREFDTLVGNLDGFQSIRFMRMYLQGFDQPVMMRFARLELVRGEWRKYTLPLYEAGEELTGSDDAGTLDVSSVNIEENGDKSPVNYVLPPGFDREIDPSNPQLQQLNEQSLLMKVTNLADGDARAVYRNVNYDMRQYKRLKMEIHAEELPGDLTLDDGELTAFIRIGSDYTNNYYEYEIPLKITPPGKYSQNVNENRETVWPAENRMDIDLELLMRAKQERNDRMREGNPNVTYTTAYYFPDGDRSIYIKGNPNIANVRTIMLGIRNPSRGNYLNATDDRAPKSGEVWFNELRLTDFKDKSGWAANARFQANLADFGTVNLAGAITTPGFGGIEQKVNERAKEETKQYDASANLEMGKFFPEKWGVTIPMYVGISETFIDPEYNPLDPDIPLEAALDNAGSKAERDSIKTIARDHTVRKSLNFSNVRINGSPDKKEAGLLAISNLSASYGIVKNEHTSYKIQKENDYEYRASLNYIYNGRPKNVTPLRKVKSFNSPWFALVKDFNFYYMPQRFSVRSDWNRSYLESKVRNLNKYASFEVPSSISKDYLWTRGYDVKYDLSKSIKVDFTATNLARYDETNNAMTRFGILGLEPDLPDPNNNPDSIPDSRPWGRTTSYSHTLNVSYNVPINKIPTLNWTSLNLRYSGNYNWDAGPLITNRGGEGTDLAIRNLGNTIKNSNNIQANTQFNLTNLYNKFGPIKRLNQKYRPGAKKKDPTDFKTITFTRERLRFTANVPKSITHKLKTEDVTVKVYNESGAEVAGDVDVIDENKITFTSKEDISNVRVVVDGKIPKGDNPIIFIAEQSARFLMGFKDFSVSYTISGATMVPGYLPGTKYLGGSAYTPDPDEFGGQVYSGSTAPGGLFLVGWQDTSFVRSKAIPNHWLTSNSTLVNTFTHNTTKALNLRSTFEPFKGFKIDFTAMRTITENFSENYTYQDNDYLVGNQRTMGNFSISTITLLTAFENPKGDNQYLSAAFEDMKQYRAYYSDELGVRRDGQVADYEPNGNFVVADTVRFRTTPGYANGYGPTSKEVLLPSFRAAYMGVEKEKVGLNKFPTIPLPNWKLTFNGLSNLEFVKRFAKTVTINHSYRSTYSIGSYALDLNFVPHKVSVPGSDSIIFSDVPADGSRDLNGNFRSLYDVNSVSISEQFAPIAGLDISWVNNLTSRIEWKKSRTIGLSFANNQINELRTDEYVIGLGYRFKDLEIATRSAAGLKRFKSDLNINADFSWRDNKTIIRNLVESTLDELNQVTAGQKSWGIKFSADYQLSESFTVRLFYDYINNRPAVSISYPTANTNFGVSIRFTLIE